jgi:hypothetical protein
MGGRRMKDSFWSTVTWLTLIITTVVIVAILLLMITLPKFVSAVVA